LRHGSRANNSYEQVGTLLAEEGRHELQVVVVDPHHRAGGSDVRQRDGEALVDRPVRVPLLAVEAGVPDRVVVQRPQRVVREPLVVAGQLVPGQLHGEEVDAVDLERLGTVVGHPGPADPGAVALAQERQQRADEPTRAGRPAVGRARDGQPVGGDDEWSGGRVGHGILARAW
jgi:hypothetical protein